MASKKKKASTGNTAADKALRRVRWSLRAKLVVFFILTAVLAISLLFSSTIEKALKLDEHLANKQSTSSDVISVIRDGELTVHFVDVGQGDCTILELPDGKTVIIDGGEKDQKNNILNYIDANLGSDFVYFDYCILTHTDSDHCGSLDDVLNEYPAQVVYRPNVVSNAKEFADPAIEITKDATADANEQFWAVDKTDADEILNTVFSKSTAAYKEFLMAAYDSPKENLLPNGETKVIVSDGRREEKRPSDKATTDIVNATAGYQILFYSPLADAYKDSNDYSNILTISYNGRNIMLTGDAEKGAEAAFVKEYAGETFDIDVLKLGHHGSRTSSSEAFLRLVLRNVDGDYSANCFIVSCGLNNKYGHPHPETMTRLTETLGVAEDNILRTDNRGTILLAVNADGASFDGKAMAISGSYSSKIEEVPLDWWHIVCTLEALGFIVIFLIIGTKKKSKGEKARK